MDNENSFSGNEQQKNITDTGTLWYMERSLRPYCFTELFEDGADWFLETGDNF